DVGVSESMDVDQPSLDTVLKDVKTIVVPFQHQKYHGKACVSPYVPPPSTKVTCKKRRRRYFIKLALKRSAADTGACGILFTS
nr:hypothetical protein [Tanacetum cinerariifolium]